MKMNSRYLLIAAILLSWLMLCSEAYSQWWTYSGGSDDIAQSIRQAPGGGYVVAGWTWSFGAGGKDFLILRLTGSGGIQWQKSFGGSGDDTAYSIQPASDSKYGDGYIVAGETNSFGAGNYDFLLLKLTTSGAVQWKTTLGGSTWDRAYSVIQASDSSYLAAGTTASYGAGLGDFLVAKVTIAGGVQWAKAYGQSGYEEAKSIRQTSDGGYVIAGWTDSYGAGGRDFLVLKVNSVGTYQWAKTYGGVHSDEAYSIDVTPDNGYVVAGYSRTSTTGSKDLLILKLSSIGNIQWQKTFGNAEDDIAYSVDTTSDGGCIVAGSQYDGSSAPEMVYVIKLSSAGAVQWQKIFNPGTGIEGANSVQQTSDGGYVLGGRYAWRFLVLKIDSAGTLPPSCDDIWSYALGNPFVSISTGVQSVAENSASLTSGNPGLAVADVAVTQYAPCTLGGSCAGQ
jgi:uncharacterized delta-60 repeat protein